MSYCTLESLIPHDATCKKISICIVTPDLLGPVKNGGIGTACTFLAQALAAYGHRVHILFTQQNLKECPRTTWAAYEKRGIVVTVAEEWESAATKGRMSPISPNHPPLRMAKTVYDWFKANDRFDLVVFMEWQGNAFYTIHGKHCGLVLQHTPLVLVIHSPSIWHTINNAELPSSPLAACTWHMERYCVEHADAVISPSSYMLDWCTSHGYRLPKHTYMQPNLIEINELQNTYTKQLDEAVFFGRLEYRKGLEQFCCALDILAKRRKMPKQVTFLGKCAWLGREHSAVYIARRAKNWKNCNIKLLTTCDQKQAVSYLCGPKRFAVMPSVADNSPYTVYECIASGIPFLARNVGGIAELLLKEDQDNVLFDDNPRHLADKMQKVLGHKPVKTRLSFDIEINRKSWCEGLVRLSEDLSNAATASSTQSNLPYISVCLTHHDRPRLLRQAIASLQRQTYTNFEVILVDDGSSSSAAKHLLNSLESDFAQRCWQILRIKNGYVGRARNIAAAHAKGQWLLFFDDDNVAAEHMLEYFARAAHTTTNSIVSTAFTIFESESHPARRNSKQVFCPMGSIVAFSAIHNTIGDATTLIKKELFERVHGFSTDYGIGHEDFELYLRLVLQEHDVTVLPESTFYYRIFPGKASVQSDTNEFANRMRSLRPFLEECSASVGELAVLTHYLATQTNLYENFSPERDLWHAEEKDALGCVGSDPQSDQVLLIVAAYLQQHGSGALATQIASAIETQDDNLPLTITQVCFDAALAVEQHEYAHLEGLKNRLTSLITSDTFDNSEKCSFYMRFINAISPAGAYAQSIYDSVVQEIEALPSQDFSRCFFLAMEHKKRNNREKALAFFLQALLAADMKYTHKRKDVRIAIEKGAFVCGLHHFVLHGYKEGVSWPYSSILSINLSVFTDFRAYNSIFKEKVGVTFDEIVNIFGQVPRSDAPMELHVGDDR